MHKRPAADKIKTLSPLLESLRPRRSAGDKLVFTNGCFELLHLGHLRLLESAAQEGELLVCAINDDRSLRRLKGSGRGIVPFEQRAALLAGLEAVDFVIGFGDATPLRLVEALEPDVLVKGDDWPLEQIVGRDIVESRGGRVVRVPRISGLSTTGILRRIRNRPQMIQPRLGADGPTD